LSPFWKTNLEILFRFRIQSSIKEYYDELAVKKITLPWSCHNGWTCKRTIDCKWFWCWQVRL